MTRILCVDDNVMLAELFVEILTLGGYETRAVFSGEECLCLLTDGVFYPDLIILDIMMVPMDGWETLKNIRNNPHWIEIPVIMLTGKHPTMSEAETYCEMIEDYFIKPYTPDRLLEEIGNVLKRVNHSQNVEQMARDHGIDHSLIRDYHKLVSGVATLRRFKAIIGDIEPFKEDLLSIKEQQFNAIKKQFSAAGID